MKVALICTAKDEDKYIDQWIEYNLKLGIDKIFIFENQWNYKGKFLNNNAIQLIYRRENTPQFQAFNIFINNFYSQFDFGIFTDADEFLYLKKHQNIKDFLTQYKNQYGIGINMISFGDNGHTTIQNNNYSVIDRFTKRQKIPQTGIRTILNFNVCKNQPKFNCPHSIIQLNKIINANKTHFINSYANSNDLSEINIIQLNHYQHKTFQEYKSKCIKRSWPDRPDRKYTEADSQIILKEFNNDNKIRNEVADFGVYDFYHKNNKKYKIGVIQFSNKSTNDNFNQMKQLSIDLNKKYCQINDYNYIYLDIDFKIDQNSDEFTKRQQLMRFCYKKYEIALKYIDTYDYLIYIDLDAAFNNPEVKIEDLILNNNKLFFFGQDSFLVALSQFLIRDANIISKICKDNNVSWLNNFQYVCKMIKKSLKIDILWDLNFISQNPNQLNAGFFILKNDQITKKFLNDVLKYKDLFDDQQAFIGKLIRLPEYNNYLNIFPLTFQGNYGLVYQQQFKYKEDQNMILHCYGQPYETRINGLKAVKNNKWWKKYF